MITVVLFLSLVSIWATAYAITVPEKIQKLLSISESDNVETLLDEMNGNEKVYLLFSAAPFALVPALLFAGEHIERASIYAVIMMVLMVISLFKRDWFSEYKQLIRLESTIELIMYCDIIRSCVVAYRG